MFRMMRWKIPWIVVFEAVVAMRRHWIALPTADRVRLALLVRKSQGIPTRLTREERAEFLAIARRLDLISMARDLAPFGRRLRAPH